MDMNHFQYAFFFSVRMCTKGKASLYEIKYIRYRYQKLMHSIWKCFSPTQWTGFSLTDLETTSQIKSLSPFFAAWEHTSCPKELHKTGLADIPGKGLIWKTWLDPTAIPINIFCPHVWRLPISRHWVIECCFWLAGSFSQQASHLSMSLNSAWKSEGTLCIRDILVSD